MIGFLAARPADLTRTALSGSLAASAVSAGVLKDPGAVHRIGGDLDKIRVAAGPRLRTRGSLKALYAPIALAGIGAAGLAAVRGGAALFGLRGILIALRGRRGQLGGI